MPSPKSLLGAELELSIGCWGRGHLGGAPSPFGSGGGSWVDCRKVTSKLRQRMRNGRNEVRQTQGTQFSPSRTHVTLRPLPPPNTCSCPQRTEEGGSHQSQAPPLRVISKSFCHQLFPVSMICQINIIATTNKNLEK